MKAILMLIRPEWIAKIFSGEKTIEIRKRFPSNFKGWVYIYCTKNGDRPIYLPWEFDCHIEDGEYSADCDFEKGNGKVVARFWCDKVEYIENTYDEFRWGEEDYNTETLNPDVLYEKSCLSFEEMNKYLKSDYGYAIPISNLEIFDKPKELNEFFGYTDKKVERHIIDFPTGKVLTVLTPLFKAPRSWQYIEVEE